MASLPRRLLTAAVSLLVLLYAPAAATAQAADSKRLGPPNLTPWQTKAKKTAPTMAILTPADPPNEALPSLAAAAIDVRIRISVPAQEEAPSPNAPRSSLDYSRPPPPSAAPPAPASNLSPPPWAAPSPAAPRPGDAVTLAAASGAVAPVVAMAAAAAPAPPAPSGIPSWTTEAFVGKAAPMRCHATRFQVIIDDRSGLVFPQLCEQPDGTFRFVP